MTPRLPNTNGFEGILGERLKKTGYRTMSLFSSLSRVFMKCARAGKRFVVKKVNDAVRVTTQLGAGLSEFMMEQRKAIPVTVSANVQRASSLPGQRR